MCGWIISEGIPQVFFVKHDGANLSTVVLPIYPHIGIDSCVRVTLLYYMKLLAKKMKMMQVWKEDVCVPVSLLIVHGGSDITELKAGDFVKVSGITKGRGWSGVMKRHGFHGGPQTHGAKNRMRHSGSIGNTSPQRVIPGRRMAGHMGMRRHTVKNLLVVDVDAAQKMVSLRGAVPGNNKRSILEIVK